MGRRSFEYLYEQLVDYTLCSHLDIVYAANKDDWSNSTTSPPPSVDPSQLINHETLLEIEHLPNAPNNSTSQQKMWQFIVTSRTIQVVTEIIEQLSQLQEHAATGRVTDATEEAHFRWARVYPGLHASRWHRYLDCLIKSCALWVAWPAVWTVLMRPWTVVACMVWCV